MSVLRKPFLLIAVGYGVAIAGGVVAVAISERLTPSDASGTSGGMVAFADMVLFVFVTGLFSVAPTWLLLKRFAEKAPRGLLVALLLIGAAGPASWAAVAGLGNGGSATPPANDVVALLVVFGAMPRIVAGPIVLAVELLALRLIRSPTARWLLVAAMLMEIVPMSFFALHMIRAAHA